MRKILFAAAAIAVLPFAAQAQMYPQHMYSPSYTSPGYAVNSSAQVLRLPEGYQPAPTTAYAPNPNGDFPQQHPTFQPANRSSMMPLSSTTTVQETAVIAPSRMLPEDTILVPATNSVTTTTTTVSPVMPTPVAFRMDSRPTSATIVTEDNATVQLRQPCGNDDLNHRSRNKAVNTSTTVFNNCLD